MYSPEHSRNDTLIFKVDTRNSGCMKMNPPLLGRKCLQHGTPSLPWRALKGRCVGRAAPSGRQSRRAGGPRGRAGARGPPVSLEQLSGAYLRRRTALKLIHVLGTRIAERVVAAISVDGAQLFRSKAVHASCCWCSGSLCTPLSLTCFPFELSFLPGRLNN